MHAREKIFFIDFECRADLDLASTLASPIFECHDKSEHLIKYRNV